VRLRGDLLNIVMSVLYVLFRNVVQQLVYEQGSTYLMY
jgi:hypothetical protein